MAMTTSTRIVLASRPAGAPTAENFRTETADLPEVGDGQVLLKVLYLSLDPYMRGRMSDAESYAEPVAVDDVMCGGTVAEVVAPRGRPRAGRLNDGRCPARSSASPVR